MAGRTIRRVSGGLGVGLVAALAIGSAVTAQSPAPVSITFWSWVPGIEDQVNAFNASQSAIQVQYVNKGNGNTEYAALKTALEANSDVPDVVQIEFQHLPSF